MKLKVKGRSKEQLKRHLVQLFNVATVVAGHGRIPDGDDIADAETLGKYWHREGNKVTILGVSNDNWAFIGEESFAENGESFVIIEFKTRYDKPGFPKQKALSNLFLQWFDFTEEA